MTPRTCTIDGCDKPTRSNSADLCAMHYFRQRRHGNPDTIKQIKSYNGTQCTIPECNRPAESRTWCDMHYQRWKKTGNPTKRLNQKWENNPSWAGDDVTYSGMHTRIRRIRGKAKNHPCQDCGNPADEWSYNYENPNPKICPDQGLPYSTDPWDYTPRCTPCHRTYDSIHRRTQEHGGAA